MQRCSICDKSVEDGIKVCPHCGHNMDFKYEMDKKEFAKRFKLSKELGLADRRGIAVIISLILVIILCCVMGYIL